MQYTACHSHASREVDVCVCVNTLILTSSSLTHLSPKLNVNEDHGGRGDSGNCCLSALLERTVEL